MVVRHLLILSALLVSLLAAPGAADARTEPITLEQAGTTFVIDAPDGMARFAELTRDEIAAHWEGVVAAAGAPADVRITVAVEDEIGDWFERHGEEPRNPEWAAGLALLGRNTILIKTANPEWRSTLRHELAHVAVDLADGEQRAPVWFHEGFAIATAEQWSLERASTMIRAGLSGNFYDFAELTRGFPPASSSADLAYAQSFHLVRWTRGEHGEGVFRDVLTRMRTEGETWDEAFLAVTGMPQAAVIAAWEEHVTTRYKWAPATVGGGGGWGLAALIGLLAWRRRKRRAAERLKELERAESRTYGSDPDDLTFG